MLRRAVFRPKCHVTWIKSESRLHYSQIRRSFLISSHPHLSALPGNKYGVGSHIPGACLLPGSNHVFMTSVRTKFINKWTTVLNHEDVRKDASNSADAIVRHMFEEDKELSAEEWDQLANKIIGFPDSNGRLIKPITLSSFILQMCVEMNAINIGKSWVEYYRIFESEDLVKLDPVLKMVLAVDTKDQLDFVKKVAWFYLSRGEKGVITVSKYWDSLELLAKTSEWEKGVEIILANDNRQQKRDFEVVIPNIAKTEFQKNKYWEKEAHENYLVRATVPFCIRALEEGKLDYLNRMMTREQFHEFQVPLRYYTFRTYAFRERLFEFIIRFSQNMEDKSAGDMLRHKLYEYFCKYDVHISWELARTLRDSLYNSNSIRQGIVNKEFTHRTKIDYISGRCGTCGNKLQRTEMTDEEFSILRKAVLETLLVADDIYKSSDPAELNKFLKLMESGKEQYDVVIDGLNVSYIRTPGLAGKFKPPALSSANCKEAVAHFHKLGKRVLLIHRKEIRGFPHFAEIDSMARIYILNSVSTDDPFFILASLYSKCLFLTGDLLRQHMVKLIKKDLYLGQLFNRWQVAHQIYLMGFEKVKEAYVGSPKFLFPPAHDVRPTKAGNYWHIPILRTGEEKGPVVQKVTYFGQSHQWICVGPQLQEDPKVKYNFGQISWPDWAKGDETDEVGRKEYFSGSIRNYNNDTDNIDQDKNYLSYGKKTRKEDGKINNLLGLLKKRDPNLYEDGDNNYNEKKFSKHGNSMRKSDKRRGDDKIDDNLVNLRKHNPNTIADRIGKEKFSKKRKTLWKND